MNTQQRKTHLLLTFFALLLSVPMTLLTSCSDDDNNGIIDKEITLNVGEVYYTGSDGVWKSDNKYIASATYNTINANRAGETVIRSNSSNIKVKVVATNFNYEEPILAFGESNDSIKNAMAAYEIKNEKMVLIFVTAVEEYVFQAFDVAAFHYLVKPFSDEKFEEVVKCAVRSIEKYSGNQSDEKYMMVQSGGSHMKVFLKDIVYAEVYNRKVIIHTRDTNIEYYGKLQELSEIAGADFFRTHRAYLVHFKYVQKYDANCVTMENGTALIAKQNYSEFVKQYLKYNQRKGKEIG